MNYLLIGLGGALGSMLRYATNQLFSGRSEPFPYATLLANVISCFVLGAAIALFSRNIIDEKQRLFLVTGFCGGLSTFSTFTFENYQLFESGNYMLFVANNLLNILVCFIFLFLGLKLF
jgi:fluoride exporter